MAEGLREGKVEGERWGGGVMEGHLENERKKMHEPEEKEKMIYFYSRCTFLRIIL